MNGKKVIVEIAGAKVNVKNSWEKGALRQQLSTSKATFTETWQVGGWRLAARFPIEQEPIAARQSLEDEQKKGVGPKAHPFFCFGVP